MAFDLLMLPLHASLSRPIKQKHHSTPPTLPLLLTAPPALLLGVVARQRRSLRLNKFSKLFGPARWHPDHKNDMEFVEDDDFDKMLGSRLVHPRSAACGDGVQFR
ncbi:unnamed protein product [Urochloa humidicola]